jgi:hypothetical protein
MKFLATILKKEGYFSAMPGWLLKPPKSSGDMILGHRPGRSAIGFWAP